MTAISMEFWNSLPNLDGAHDAMQDPQLNLGFTPQLPDDIWVNNIIIPNYPLYSIVEMFQKLTLTPGIWTKSNAAHVLYKVAKTFYPKTLTEWASSEKARNMIRTTKLPLTVARVLLTFRTWQRYMDDGLLHLSKGDRDFDAYIYFQNDCSEMQVSLKLHSGFLGFSSRDCINDYDGVNALPQSTPSPKVWIDLCRAHEGMYFLDSDEDEEMYDNGGGFYLDFDNPFYCDEKERMDNYKEHAYAFAFTPLYILLCHGYRPVHPRSLINTMSESEKKDYDYIMRLPK